MMSPSIRQRLVGRPLGPGHPPGRGGLTLIEPCSARRLPQAPSCIERLRTQSGKHNAFTLIELLVVIAIIVLLAAILLPTLRTARESARRKLCLGDLRQSYLALVGYSDDNGGFTPIAIPAQYFTMASPGEVENPVAGVTWYPNTYRGLYPYLRNWRVWLCPSFVGNAKSYNANIIPWFPNGTWWPAMYGWLEAQGGPLPGGGLTSYCYMTRSTLVILAWDPGSGAFGQQSLRLGQDVTVQGSAADPQNLSPNPALKTYAQMPVFSDVTFLDGYMQATYFQSQHWQGGNLGGNVSYGDGHVVWLDWPKWVYIGYPEYIYHPPYE